MGGQICCDAQTLLSPKDMLGCAPRPEGYSMERRDVTANLLESACPEGDDRPRDPCFNRCALLRSLLGKEAWQNEERWDV